MSGIVTTDYLRCFGGVRWSDAIDSVVILSITVIILFFFTHVWKWQYSAQMKENISTAGDAYAFNMVTMDSLGSCGGNGLLVIDKT